MSCHCRRLLIVFFVTSGESVDRFWTPCETSSSLDAFEQCLLQYEQARSPCDRNSFCPARAGRGAIFFQHLRKAGGTSLRIMVSRSLCETQLQLGCDVNVTAFTEEMNILAGGHPIIQAQPNMSTALTLITALRDPIDRIVSLFWFEGKCMSPQGTEIPAGNEKCTLRQWFEHMVKKHEREACGSPRAWTSVENYYVHVLAGAPPCRAAGPEDYRVAARRLAAFDAVFITEDFGNKMTSRVFDALLPSPCRPRRKPFTALHFRRNENRPQISGSAANDPELDFIREHNIWDSRLYNFAKKLWSLQVSRNFGTDCPLENCHTYPVSPRRASTSRRQSHTKLGLQIAPFLSQPDKAPAFGCERDYLPPSVGLRS